MKKEKEKGRVEDFVARNLLGLRAESSYVGDLFSRAKACLPRETLRSTCVVVYSVYTKRYSVVSTHIILKSNILIARLYSHKVYTTT